MATAAVWRGVQVLDSERPSLPMPEVPVHWLEAPKQLSDAFAGNSAVASSLSVQNLRIQRPSEFVADLQRLSCAIIGVPEALSSPIAEALRLAPEVFNGLRTDAANAALSGFSMETSIASAGITPTYRQQGNLKERLLLRRDAPQKSSPKDVMQCNAGYPAARLDTEPIVETLAKAFAVLEAISRSCFQAWCQEAGVSAEEALQRFGDNGHAPNGCVAGKGKSVLNLYHYYNDESCDEEPCREHADPGLITLLCRSTNAALQVRLPSSADNGSESATSYEEAWRDVEPTMDTAIQNHESVEEPRFVMLVAVGETLERLSGRRLPACQHRVARVVGPRLNMAYEMRPRVNVWQPWETLAPPTQDHSRSTEANKGGKTPYEKPLVDTCIEAVASEEAS